MSFTAIIQGPLSDECLEYIPTYFEYIDEVVLSCWADGISEDQHQRISLLEHTYGDSFKCVLSPLPSLDLVKLWMPDQSANYYYQIYSTHKGMEQVTTKYAIKMRTDEYYSNLAPLIDVFLRDDEKFVSGNVFFKSVSVYPYHISDHLFVAKSSVLKKSFSLMVDQFNSKDKPKCRFLVMSVAPKENIFFWKKSVAKSVYKTAIEAVIAKVCLLYMGVPEEQIINDVRGVMGSKIDICDVNMLGSYRARWNRRGIIYNDVTNKYSGATTMEQILVP